MLKNDYLLAKIGVDTAENESVFVRTARSASEKRAGDVRAVAATVSWRNRQRLGFLRGTPIAEINPDRWWCQDGRSEPSPLKF